MELVYLSDVHDAFGRVKELLSRTSADVYVIAGDLIDRPFYTKEMSARYRKKQASFSDFAISWDTGKSTSKILSTPC